jgi:hypothetical protein
MSTATEQHMAGVVGESMEVWDDMPKVAFVKKPTLRMRVTRWLLGVEPPQPMLATTGARAGGNLAMGMAEKGEAIELIDHNIGQRFRIIRAGNGHIIGYYKRTEGDRLGKVDEQFHVVKEGERLLDAIATCLALDRVKS